MYCKILLIYKKKNIFSSVTPKHTDYAPNSIPKGILDNVPQTQKMSDPPSLNDRESPLGSVFKLFYSSKFSKFLDPNMELQVR